MRQLVRQPPSLPQGAHGLHEPLKGIQLPVPCVVVQHHAAGMDAAAALVAGHLFKQPVRHAGLQAGKQRLGHGRHLRRAQHAEHRRELGMAQRQGVRGRAR